MSESAALDAFQSSCHELYTCFVFASDGMEKLSQTLPVDESKYPNQKLYIGNMDRGQGPAQSVMSAKKAIESARRDGEFQDMLAKSLLVRLYAEWEEFHRSQIAHEYGVPNDHVLCGLMGELRRVRNWIVHNRSIVKRDVSRISVLPWVLKEGVEMKVSSQMMREFMTCANNMKVDLKPTNISLQRP